MSVESFDPKQQAVTVTPAALAHFRRQLGGQQGKAVRLSVKKSGCTGFKYVIDLVEQAGASDLHYQLDEQVELLVADVFDSEPGCLDGLHGRIQAGRQRYAEQLPRNEPALFSEVPIPF